MTQQDQDQDQYKIEWEALVKLYDEANSRGDNFSMRLIQEQILILGVTEMPWVDIAPMEPYPRTHPLDPLVSGKIYLTANGKTVRVTRVIHYTAWCSDGRVRSNTEADRGKVNTNIYPRDYNIVSVSDAVPPDWEARARELLEVFDTMD